MIKQQFIDEKRHRKMQSVKHLELVDTNEEHSLESIYLQQEEAHNILKFLDSEERGLLFLWAVEGYTVKKLQKKNLNPEEHYFQNYIALKRGYKPGSLQTKNHM